jgi:hypothetical protein
VAWWQGRISDLLALAMRLHDLADFVGERGRLESLRRCWLRLQFVDGGLNGADPVSIKSLSFYELRMAVRAVGMARVYKRRCPAYALQDAVQKACVSQVREPPVTTLLLGSLPLVDQDMGREELVRDLLRTESSHNPARDVPIHDTRLSLPAEVEGSGYTEVEFYPTNSSWLWIR